MRRWHALYKYNVFTNTCTVFQGITPGRTFRAKFRLQARIEEKLLHFFGQKIIKTSPARLENFTTIRSFLVFLDYVYLRFFTSPKLPRKYSFSPFSKFLRSFITKVVISSLGTYTYARWYKGSTLLMTATGKATSAN